MNDYKAVMDLLERIGAFETANRPHKSGRVLKISKQIAEEELLRANRRENWQQVKRERRHAHLADAEPSSNGSQLGFSIY